MQSRKSPGKLLIRSEIVPLLVAIPIFLLFALAQAWVVFWIFLGIVALTMITRLVLLRREPPYDWNDFRGRGVKSVPSGLQLGEELVAVIEVGVYAQRLARLQRSSDGWRLTIPARARTDRVVLDKLSQDALEAISRDWQIRFLSTGDKFEKAYSYLSELDSGNCGKGGAAVT